MPIDRRHFFASAAAAALYAATRNRAYAASPRTTDAALVALRQRLGDRLIAPTDARYEI